MAEEKVNLVQCRVCGRNQQLIAHNPFCENCGAALEPKKAVLLKKPRFGNGLKAAGAFLLIASSQVFFFLSNFWGILLGVIALLIFFWGAHRAAYYRKGKLK